MPKVVPDELPDAHVLRNPHGQWFKISDVCAKQVYRALNEPGDNEDGERGLAVVAIAVLLEAWMRRACEGIELPEWFVEECFPQRTPTLYRALPRLCQVDRDKCETFESDPIHSSVKQIFALRNQFAHASEKWDHRAARGTNLQRLWETALDAILLLERTGNFDLPSSRIEDFSQEITSLKRFEGFSSH